jgi:hypothetical protein
MIEQDLRTALIGYAPLTAIVGQNIAALVVPESAASPYVTYQTISGQRESTMSQPGTRINARIQLSCFAATYAQAKAIAQAVQSAVESSLLFASVFLGYQDLYDPETKQRYVVIDYSLWQ